MTEAKKSRLLRIYIPKQPKPSEAQRSSTKFNEVQRIKYKYDFICKFLLNNNGNKKKKNDFKSYLLNFDLIFPISKFTIFENYLILYQNEDNQTNNHYNTSTISWILCLYVLGDIRKRCNGWKNFTNKRKGSNL